MIDIKHYRPQPSLLKDKIIIVTGAGSGIGQCMAKAYAGYGARVVLMGKTISKLEAVYDEIEQAGHPTPAIFPLDFATATEQEYRALSAAIEENFGRLDGLLNNASVPGEMTSIANYPLKVFEQVLAVNVTAPFALTQCLLPQLQKSESASIIFTGSTVGYRGQAYWGAYAVSKAATENLMEVLADELEHTSAIRVNSINPGATRTAMRATAYPAEDPGTLKTAEALIPLYTYLISDDSKGVSGTRHQG